MTGLIAELADILRRYHDARTAAAVTEAEHDAIEYLAVHHAEIEAMARDAARYQTLKDADVWSDEVWHAIDERDSDGLDEALDAMHNSAREVGE